MPLPEPFTSIFTMGHPAVLGMACILLITLITSTKSFSGLMVEQVHVTYREISAQTDCSAT